MLSKQTKSNTKLQFLVVFDMNKKTITTKKNNNKNSKISKIDIGKCLHEKYWWFLKLKCNWQSN